MNGKDLPPYDIMMNIIRETITTAWNIGNKIHQPNIDRWLNNFTGESLSETLSISEAKSLERDLALFLLCNFVFYNENEIKHLAKVMFRKYIHNIFDSNDTKNTDDNVINDLLTKTQFVPLGTVSESSSYLLYRFRQENNLSSNNFKKESHKENIVFVDDFSISGTQLISNFSEYLTDNSSENKKYFMLFMVVTDEALNEFSEKANELYRQGKTINILPCTIMDDRSKTFSCSSVAFDGYKDYYKIQAEKMCTYYGRQLIDTTDEEMKPLGYKNGGYMLGSYYNTPDNTLPIFWSEKNNWQCIFKRYNKNYAGRINFGGKYV